MQLLYDHRDVALHERLGSRILYWLDDLDAVPVTEAKPDEPAFLFAGARSLNDYRRLVDDLPLLRDRPEEREPLLRLDTVLQTLALAGVHIPSPRTWVLPLDAALPDDLTFPLFLRTAVTSWKKGGQISKVKTPKQLVAEAGELRRALGWDAVILARQWLSLAKAGNGRYGPMPQEVRTWAVDGVPIAWSFHHLHIVPRPTGFPPSSDDLTMLARMAAEVASAFTSRLVVADFARGVDGQWWFIEAGLGSCAGTAHETVFKAVACRLKGDEPLVRPDAVGGPF